MKYIFKDNISAHTFRLSLVRQGKKCTVFSVRIDGKIVWIVSDEDADSTKGARFSS